MKQPAPKPVTTRPAQAVPKRRKALGPREEALRKLREEMAAAKGKG